MVDSSTEGSGDLRVNRGLVIPAGELQWRATTSGGPGGQHANRSSTRVEVRFEVERSSVLGPRQRARLLARLGPVVRASAAEHRSQWRNRALARDRLAERLRAGLLVERPRRPTTPTRSSAGRRLDGKRRRSQTKALRRRPAESD